jgi:hypothetical protein
MPHDEHFLRRLERVEHDRDQFELAMGLYRDHELVRFILSHVRLPDEADRVALALEDGGAGPHVVVARGGPFVTCLGPGMSTGALPIVSRARIDALAEKVEGIRRGLALARERGVDETRILDRIQTAGPAFSREDFVSASAILGPAIPLLSGIYSSWGIALEDVYGALVAGRRGDAVAKRRALEAEVARGAWAMVHASLLLANTASREWVNEWASFPEQMKGSFWSVLVMHSGFPFVVRAAWIAARLGKPTLPVYKARYLKAIDPVDLRECGWAMICMALRHESIRTETLKALRSAPRAPDREPWVDELHGFFAKAAEVAERKEETLRHEAIDLGRDSVVVRTSGAPETARHRYTERSQVPDDLALPGLFAFLHDANNGDRAADLMLIGTVVAARAKAEDFYFPAAVLHDMGPPDFEEIGSWLVGMRSTMVGKPKTVRAEPRPGRNDPCSCGSGKKYKKCHGA